MAFQVSPGIIVTEKDFTDTVPATSTSVGAFAGLFKWGPVEDIVQIGSENELVAIFNMPDSDTYKSFFAAANFLSYGSILKVVRVVGQTAENASSAETRVRGGSTAAENSSSSSTSSESSSSQSMTTSSSSSSTTDNVIIKNQEDFDSQTLSAIFVAKYPGKLGNALHVSICDDADVFADSWVSLVNGTATDQAGAFSAVAPSTSTFASNKGASSDEMHIIIRDKDGSWTGTPGTILERFSFVSKALDAVRSDGTSNYYKNVINTQSQYIWAGAKPTGGTNWGTAASSGLTYDTIGQSDYTFRYGKDGSDSVTDSEYNTGFNLFADPETVSIQLLIAGSASQAVARNVVDIADTRKDCVAFLSPEYSDIQPGVASATKLANVLDYEQTVLNKNSSYAVLDSGWKYQYDIYNDTFRYVPLCSDTAGLCARTDVLADPWYSPAGFNRGQIKNVVKLAFNPTKSQRDSLYQRGINPVVAFPGEGTVLFGDKTLLKRPSAFDRINVRRLFLVMEKAITHLARGLLFEFNDDFTRANFLSAVEPFLRDIQGRRGISDFRVICDERNNTQGVIDRQEFVADIYVKPNRSINFIQLNFIATRNSINLSEA